MPTKAEIKQQAKHIKLKVRTGDKIKVIAGKDKGQVGYVAAVSPKENKAIILKENPENPDQPLPLNRVIKHKKARFQGERSARVALPAAIHISNLIVIDPSSGEPSRIGRRKEGDKLVRYAKKSGATIVDAPAVKEEK